MRQKTQFDTLLVTGGAGFIGSNFVKHVMEMGVTRKVVVLDAFTYAGTPENLSPFIEKTEVLITTSGKAFDSVDWNGRESSLVLGPKEVPREWEPKLQRYSKAFLDIDGFNERLDAFVSGDQDFLLVVGSITDLPLVEVLMKRVDAIELCCRDPRGPFHP